MVGLDESEIGLARRVFVDKLTLVEGETVSLFAEKIEELNLDFTLEQLCQVLGLPPDCTSDVKIIRAMRRMSTGNITIGLHERYGFPRQKNPDNSDCLYNQVGALRIVISSKIKT